VSVCRVDDKNMPDNSANLLAGGDTEKREMQDLREKDKN
jgi:hypothetical protein